jgi:hypothetical protein
MTFTEALIASGYHYQPECDCYCKEDSQGYLHSYAQLDDEDTWNYEKYNDHDQLLISQSFTLN